MEGWFREIGGVRVRRVENRVRGKGGRGGRGRRKMEGGRVRNEL